jgi:O-antigen ligase
VVTPFEKVSYALIGLLFVCLVAIDLSNRRARHRGRLDNTVDHESVMLQRQAIMALIAAYAGTLVWRIRTADELASNPLDPAGLVRLGFDGLALGLAIMTLIQLGARRKRLHSGRQPISYATPVKLYCLYIAAVLAGVFTAVEPKQVAFRAFELAVIATAATAATRCLTLEQVLGISRRIIYTLTASVVLSVVLFGREAATPAGGLIPFRLQGLLPNISYNSVGTFGIFLVALGAGPKKINKLALALGLLLVVLAQYRTGYVAVLIMFGVWLLVRGRAAGALITVIMAYPAWLVLNLPVVGELWVRGDQAEYMERLGGRTVFWARAIEVADRSPIIGTGLTSGTRNEVFPGLGRGVISTIHSTWIEAYLGVGIIGIALVAVIFLQAAIAAWKIRANTLVPLLVLTGIAVRSITGTTIELAGGTLVFFLMIVFAAWRENHGFVPETQETLGQGRATVLSGSAGVMMSVGQGPDTAVGGSHLRR